VKKGLLIWQHRQTKRIEKLKIINVAFGSGSSWAGSGALATCKAEGRVRAYLKVTHEK